MLPRILIVEADDMNRDMLSRRLELEDFEVVSATDGVKGLAVAGSESPELILMDMSLPSLDGWEMTKCLKSDPTLSHIPVITLTAHAMSEDRKSTVGVGSDEFETKPILWDQPMNKMNAFLSGRISP